jgi:hypothetical protein
MFKVKNEKKIFVFKYFNNQLTKGYKYKLYLCCFTKIQ